MSLVTSAGLLLRAHDYSESSRIMRFLTPRMGVVAVIAKGARRRSARGEEPIQMFGEGTLTFVHRADRDLHTLRDFQADGGPLRLRGYRRFVAASVIAELILVHSLEEGDPELYEWVRASLETIGETREAELAGTLLAGAWRTLALLGFPPQLGGCVRCGVELSEPSGGEDTVDLLRLDIAAGGLVCPRCAGDSAMPRIGPTARGALVRMVAGEVPSGLQGVGPHLSILESFALHHLAPSRKLRSFEAARRVLAGGEQGAPEAR